MGDFCREVRDFQPALPSKCHYRLMSDLCREVGGVCTEVRDYQPALKGDIISVLFNVTIVPLILYLLLRKAEKRPIFFDWLITISSLLFVCLGTVLRVHLISGNEWGAIADISRSTVKYYFTQSLASWIACIVLDGRLTLNLCRAYQTKKLLASRPTPMQVLEFFGLFTSFASMVKLAIDIYSNFHYLTQDVSLHIWFALAVLFKESRILIQGLAVLVNTQYLWRSEHKTLARQILLSSIFALFQVFFLARFTRANWLSTTLLMGDMAYRTYQCLKIIYYLWYYDQSPMRQDTGGLLFTAGSRLYYTEKLPCSTPNFDRKLSSAESEVHDCHKCSKLAKEMERPEERDGNDMAPLIKVFSNMFAN